MKKPGGGPERVLILGGGLAGLSLAYFLKRPSVVLEKERRLGGLCRSFRLRGITYDIGPHILFSHDEKILNLHTTLTPTARIRRSNQIFHRGRLVKYPFENDLAALPPEERDYCLNEFLHNPYERYAARNMLQFYLKTFGEGITRTYLQPYNEKIWKFDPAFMDTQMVERIPKPPPEDVIKSAQGQATEGYLHQLYFHYPRRGGIQALVDAYARGARVRARLVHPVAIRSLRRENSRWLAQTDHGTFASRTLVNCLPLHQLFGLLSAPEDIRRCLASLLYNSIHILVVQVKKDRIGNHFALYFPGRDTIFHRLSKLNFLGAGYCLPKGGSTLLLEITFRPQSHLSTLNAETVTRRALQDLAAQGLIRQHDVLATELRTFEYAYPIYDLNHRRNADRVLNYLRRIGIRCSGRFAEFEYLNTDAVAQRSQRLARELDRA